MTFYFGACAGGVWRTTSGGQYWENLSDGHFASASVGALVVPPANPDVIYVGTGESCIRADVAAGDGVYKSTDGGESWTHCGLTNTRHISRILVNPADPDDVYVAALGHTFGPNAERGVFHSRDGGQTWTHVLHVDSQTGAADLAMDPHDSNCLYAAMWQFRRQPHRIVSGGARSGLWRSSDGGETWTDLTAGLGMPEGHIGRIGLATSPARPGRVWALIEARGGGLFRSDDGGDSWKRIAEAAPLRRRPWYFMHLCAHPKDPDILWGLSNELWLSTDGGSTFSVVPIPHGDNHAMWVDPSDPDRIIEGHDGGACVTFDGGRTWSSMLNQPTAQFYSIAVDDAVPYQIYGAQQDNWAIRLPSMSFEGAITVADWVEPGGGESGSITVGPAAPHYVFCGGTGAGLGHGRIVRWDPRTGQRRNVTVWPEIYGLGSGAEAHRYRFRWTTPLHHSPHDPHVVYACSQVVHRSVDDGGTWFVISPDLTRADADRLGPSGGPITIDNAGPENYCTISALRESPRQPGVLWVGSDDGLVHTSRDNGVTWTHVTVIGLPAWAEITSVEPSPHDDHTVYLTASRHKHDEPRPMAYRTTDSGRTWTTITNGLAETDHLHVLREDPQRAGLMFAGTETGIFVSFDHGDRWQRLQGLPVVPVYDLTVVGDDLVLATHGRSVWILDDLALLRQLDAGIWRQPQHLFTPAPSYRWRVHDRAFEENESTQPGYVSYKAVGAITVALRLTPDRRRRFLDAGANPDIGVAFRYWLSKPASVDASLRIRDSRTGALVRVLTPNDGLPTQEGINRFVWDMRGEPPQALNAPISMDSPLSQWLGNPAPLALPGRYTAELSVAGQTSNTEFQILPDPRVDLDLPALTAQYELKAALCAQLSQVHQLLDTIWHARQRLNHTDQTLGRIESSLIQQDGPDGQRVPAKLREKIIGLLSMIDESDDAPTAGAVELAQRLAELVGQHTADVQQVLATLTAHNQTTLEGPRR